MSDQLLKAMNEEIEGLEAKFRPDPDFARLQWLWNARREYAGMTATVVMKDGSRHEVSAAAPTPAPALATNFPKHPRIRKSADPNREFLLNSVADFLSTKHEPTKTSDIFAYCELLSIPIAGENPRNNLSAILHNSKRFKSYGRAGWLLPQYADEYERRLRTLPGWLQPSDEEGAASVS